MKIIIHYLKQLFPLTYWEIKQRSDGRWFHIWKQWFGIKYNYRAIKCPIDARDDEYVHISTIITKEGIDCLNKTADEIAKNLREEGINCQDLVVKFAGRIIDKWRECD